jgi:hypothetical protein
MNQIPNGHHHQQHPMTAQSNIHNGHGPPNNNFPIGLPNGHQNNCKRGVIWQWHSIKELFFVIANYFIG